jgi:hypothetical protein
MTKKDYIALASALRESRQIAEGQDTRTGKRAAARFMVEETVHSIAKVLQADNPRFDWTKFEDATKV